MPSQHSQIFVKSSHFVWDPSRQRKLRRKLGNLIKSPQDTLDTMLEEHLSDVQNLLLEKKAEYEEKSQDSSRADDVPPALRSPPIIGGGGVGGGLRSPKGPPLGYFSVSSPVPKSPRSPMKRV